MACRDVPSGGHPASRGSFEEIAFSEAEVAAAGTPSRRSPRRATRRGRSLPAPAGRHAFWTYCHVPAGSTLDVTESIAAQVERFAPGFRDLVLASSTRTAADLQAHNPNYIGGDISPACRICARRSSGQFSGGTRTVRRSRATTSARRQRRRPGRARALWRARSAERLAGRVRDPPGARSGAGRTAARQRPA